jgi:hypothetical protein
MTLVFGEWLKSWVKKIHEMSWIDGIGVTIELTAIPSIDKDLYRLPQNGQTARETAGTSG